MQFKVLSLASLAVLYLAPAISAYAIPSEDAPTSVAELKALHDLEEAFAIIESVPEEVLNSGDEAAKAWAHEHYQIKGAKKPLEKRVPWLDIGQCAKELLENLPWGRAKKLIDAIGGWKKTAEALRKAAKDPAARKGALEDLIDIITGIPSLKKECWDDFRD